MPQDVADLCSMRSETSVRRGLRALPYLQAVVRRDQHDAEPSVDANVNEERSLFFLAFVEVHLNALTPRAASRDPRMLGILRTFHPPGEKQTRDANAAATTCAEKRPRALGCRYHLLRAAPLGGAHVVFDLWSSDRPDLLWSAPPPSWIAHAAFIRDNHI
eukprot:3927122-Rhodomonas_salina.5